MTYEEAAAYIADIPKFTKKNTKEHTRLFLEALGCGEQSLSARILHVAGTNGKGSVCAYLQALLLSEGRKTGAFFSPHLVKMNERIRISGIPVSDAQFLESFQAAYAAAAVLKEKGFAHPTFFEFLFGMAVFTFRKEQVDDIILETGLGGRLDATNVFENPALTVITSISMDHMQYLGDTVEEIAAEKAGIIKKGVPLVFSAGEEKSAAVLRRQAEKLGAPCREIGKNAYEIKKITAKDIAFSSPNAYYENTVWELSNPGIYQAENAMLALGGMAVLYGEKKHLKRWKDALLAVHWEGRMEEVRPGVYLDGAHNTGAVEAFADTLLQEGFHGKRVILFSAVSDKDYREMIRILCERQTADVFVVTEISDERRTQAETLAKLFRTYTGKKVLVEQKLSEAVRCAWKEKGPEGRLYCLGSLYLTGMLKELLGRQDIC